MTDYCTYLSALTASLAQARVLCVGDIMLDRFITGTVDRISPEAPIPVMRVLRETAMLGGAGNVVRNLVGLETGVTFLSVVGDDEPGQRVRDMLSACPGVTLVLQTEPGRRTPTKTRFIAGTQQLLRTDEETIRDIPSSLEQDILTHAEQSMPRCGALVLSDYGKGVLTRSATQALISIARRYAVPVIVDPKGLDYSRYHGATLVTPNKKELSEASSSPTGTDAEIIAAARILIHRCGIESVLATRSQDGMSLIGANDQGRHFPAQAREVFDVSGAGDTVVATVAAALAAGAPLEMAARLSNIAAGIVVGKVGTAAVHAEEIREIIRQQDIESAETKILPLPRAIDQAETWRRKGYKIGFTNGCFDLLHPGHLLLLQQARSACDRLIVGLNSDASVRRLKGKNRPVQSEQARALLLASLILVDAVVVFNEETPLSLIRVLLPDVLVKGADYTIDTIVGADTVQAYGGKVILAELEPAQSTTNTIRRIMETS